MESEEASPGDLAGAASALLLSGCGCGGGAADLHRHPVRIFGFSDELVASAAVLVSLFVPPFLKLVVGHI